MIRLLRQAWSPDQIAGWGRRTGQLRISYETIYRYRWDDRRAGGQLYRLLRGARRRRVGHWEIDTVAGATSREGILTVVERKTGSGLIGKLAAHTAAAFTHRSIQLLRRQHRPVRTITADNGSEISG